MNEDTNRNSEQNLTNVVPVENSGVVNNDSGSDVSSNINVTGIVEEVSFNYPENSETQQVSNEGVGENSNTATTNIQTVVDASASSDVNNTIEEVSISTDSSSLDQIDTSVNSVFNSVNEEESLTGGMKEGQENRAVKTGFPYGMVIGFVVLIICAFFIDNIVVFVEDFILNKDEVVEEENEKNEEQESSSDEE